MEHFKLLATKLAISSQKVAEIQQKLAKLSQDPVMAGNDAIKRAMEQADQSAANLEQIQNTITEKLEAATGVKASSSQPEADLPTEALSTPQPEAEQVPEIHTQFEDYGTGAQDQFSRFEGQIEDSLDKPVEELAQAWDNTPAMAQELASELPTAEMPMAEATTGTFNQIGVQTDDFDDSFAQTSPAFAEEIAQLSPDFGEGMTGGFADAQESMDFSNGIGASFDDYAAEPTTPSFGEPQDAVQVANMPATDDAKVMAESLPKTESNFTNEAKPQEEQPAIGQPQPSVEKPQTDLEKAKMGKDEETVPYRERIVSDFNPKEEEIPAEKLAKIEANKKQYEEAVEAGETQMKPLQEELEDNVQENKKREKRPEDSTTSTPLGNNPQLPDLDAISQATKSPSLADNTNQGSNDSQQVAESVQNFAMFASSLCNTLKNIDWDAVTDSLKDCGLWQSVDSLFKGVFDADEAVDNVKKAVEQIKNKLEEAQNAADKAQEAAEKAEEATEIAQQVADESHEVAWAAQVAAEDAQQAAEEAQGVAEDAKEAVDEAQEKAEEAAEEAAEKVEDVNKATEQVQKNAYGLEMGKRTTLNWEDNVEKRKKPEAKKKKGSINTNHIAVANANIKCTYYNKEIQLWVSPIHLKKIKGKYVGTIYDCEIQNLMFGDRGDCLNINCKLATTVKNINGDEMGEPFQCRFKPLGIWDNGDKNFIVDGAPALQIGSTLSCVHGGTLTITSNGQPSASTTDESTDNDESDESTLEDSE